MCCTISQCFKQHHLGIFLFDYSQCGSNKTQTGICCNIAQLCVPNITTVCGLALFFFFLTWLLSAGRQKVTSRVPMKRFSMFRKELALFPTDLSTCYSLIKPPPQPDAGTDQQVDIDWRSATTHQHMHLSELDVF